MSEAEDKDSLELMNPYLGVKKAPPGPRILNTWHMCMKQNIQEVHISGIRTYVWHHMVIYKHKEFSKCFLQTVYCFICCKTDVYWHLLAGLWPTDFNFHIPHVSLSPSQGHQHHFLFYQIGLTLTDLLCRQYIALRIYMCLD